MAEFTVGDVFVSVANGRVQWYRPSGTSVSLIDTLDTGLGGFTTGSAFDASNKLYVTAIDAGRISVFNTDGTLSGAFGSFPFTRPESIVFDQNGDVYVGQAGGSGDIVKLNAAGTFLESFDVETENVGSDWIDLAADQRTMFYTSEGKRVMRFDVVSNTQLADLTNSLPGTRAFALRIIPSTGDILVADSEVVVRINGMTGSVLQTYLSTENLGGLFALNLDPDGISFWTADFNTAEVYKVDILTGDVLLQFNTGTGPITVFGLSVKGEITAAVGADLSVTKTDSLDPVIIGENLSYTVTVTNNGPADATNVTLTDTLPAGVIFISATPSQGSCSEAGGVVTCNLGTLVNGDITTVDIEVAPTAPGTITNTATVTATEADPNPDNNTDTESTTVRRSRGK